MEILSLLFLTLTTANISATGIIILVTIITSYMAESNPDFKRKWMMNPYSVKHRGEYYRMITSGFVHSGYMHLAFNMITFYYFGNTIEAIFKVIMGEIGVLVFIAFYLIAIVISDLPTFFKHKDNYVYNSLGASGGVSALVFAGILFNPTAQLMIMFLPVALPAFVIGLFYLLYSIYMAKNSNDHINHDAHLYGALFGIIFSIIIYPPVIQLFIQQVKEWAGFF